MKDDLAQKYKQKIVYIDNTNHDDHDDHGIADNPSETPDEIRSNNNVEQSFLNNSEKSNSSKKTDTKDSSYKTIHEHESIPKSVKKLGNVRSKRKLLYSEGYFTKEIEVQSTDLPPKTSVISVDKRQSITPVKVDAQFKENLACVFCHRIPLNPFKTVPCAHLVCLTCYREWVKVTYSNCPKSDCRTAISGVEVLSDIELVYLRNISR